MIETFEMEELTETKEQDNEEQIALIESLGLEGQKKLINPDKTSVIPYPECTQEQKLIIGTLCPISVDYREYRRTQIPLRVLQVIAHVEEQKYFTKILIFDKQSENVKDPFVIGFIEDHSVPYLLARWGEELEAWSVLREKVKKIIMEQKKLFKKRAIRVLEDSMDDDRAFNMPFFSLPSISSWGGNNGFADNSF